jgi:hypothetical protein
MLSPGSQLILPPGILALDRLLQSTCNAVGNGDVLDGLAQSEPPRNRVVHCQDP